MFDPSRVDDLKFIQQKYREETDPRKKAQFKKIGLSILNQSKELIQHRAYLANAARRGDSKTVKEISNYIKNGHCI